MFIFIIAGEERRIHPAPKIIFGGRSRIRTCDPLRDNDFRDRPIQPLWHPSHFGTGSTIHAILISPFKDNWRRGRDSNSRSTKWTPVFKTGRLNHSRTSPSVNHIIIIFCCQLQEKLIEYGGEYTLSNLEGDSIEAKPGERLK